MVDRCNYLEHFGPVSKRTQKINGPIRVNRQRLAQDERCAFRQNTHHPHVGIGQRNFRTCRCLPVDDISNRAHQEPNRKAGCRTDSARIRCDQVEEITRESRGCPTCASVRAIHGYRTRVLDPLFGRIQLMATRLRRCPCDTRSGAGSGGSISPLA